MFIEEGLESEYTYILSHLGILKVFALWGLLEAIIFMLTNGDKMKEVWIHLIIFVIISIMAYYYPEIKNNLK
jgi:hypothetical protein